MLLHYLKIAFRNLFKYKTQTIVSILGLAIGFTAFSFTMSWIRYEMGYDSHNPDRDRIYMVAKVDEKSGWVIKSGAGCFSGIPEKKLFRKWKRPQCFLIMTK